MAVPANPPPTRGPGTRAHASARRWLQIGAALLLGAGAVVQVAAGWARTHRVWWLAGAGVCAVLAALLPLLTRRNQNHPPAPDGSPVGVHAEQVAFDAAATVVGQQTAGRGSAVIGTLHQAPLGPGYQAARDLIINNPPATPASSPPAPSPPLAGRRVWNIPPPVRGFVGRTEQLTEVRERLLGQQTAVVAPAAALHGMGGVGKTQLARAYAHHYRHHYQLGWWLTADTPTTLTTTLAQLAPRLGLPANLPEPDVLAAVHQALGDRDGWLVVFDNADTPAILERFLPPTGNGHVLITSRSHAWRALAAPILVDLLSVDQAVELLVGQSGDRDEAAGRVLAEALGRLPLALAQAAAYVDAERLTLADYHTLLRARQPGVRGGLLAKGDPAAHHDTVDHVFTLAVARLQERAPAAAELLTLCAMLAPDQLPVKLLLSQPELLPDRLAAAAADPAGRHELVGTLFRAALLTPDSGDTARVHRLVQAVILDHLPNVERRIWTRQAVALLAELFSDDPWESDTWDRCERLLAHADTTLGHARQQDLDDPVCARLLTRTVRYRRARHAELPTALQDAERAVAMRRRLYGDRDHPDLASSLTSLGGILDAMGDHAAAVAYREQATAMQTRLRDHKAPG